MDIEVSYAYEILKKNKKEIKNKSKLCVFFLRCPILNISMQDNTKEIKLRIVSYMYL